jgi:hypothetical protein
MCRTWARFCGEPPAGRVTSRSTTGRRGSKMCRVARGGAARSRGEHLGAGPESRAVQAQKGAAAERTPAPDRIREVSHNLVAARRRTVVVRPRVVVDRSREAGHTRVVALRTRVRVAPCRRTAVAYSRVVADRTEVGHNRVAADKRTAAAHNRAVADRTRGVSHIRAAAHKMADRPRQCTAVGRSQVVAGSHPGLQQQMPSQRAAPLRWQSQCKRGARHPLFGCPRPSSTLKSVGVFRAEISRCSGSSVRWYCFQWRPYNRKAEEVGEFGARCHRELNRAMCRRLRVGKSFFHA